MTIRTATITFDLLPLNWGFSSTRMNLHNEIEDEVIRVHEWQVLCLSFVVSWENE